MLEIPRRTSLPNQTATAIRKAIELGTWRERLPSERRLCEMLRVSRPTLRTAIGILAKEKLIEVHQGRAHQILERRQRPQKHTDRHIGLVIQDDGTRYSYTEYYLLHELRLQLADHGFSSEFIRIRQRSQGEQFRSLQMHVNNHPASHWLLISVSERVQRWFAENGLPGLIMGSCHPTIELPSFDIDHFSVCRHAADVFLRHGHRRLAFLVPDSGLAGDQVSESGFNAAVDKEGRAMGASAVIVRHNGTPEHLKSRLDSLFRSDRPPTAILVAKPWNAIAALAYLMQHGHAVPEQVSLICRDQEPLFEQISPVIAHYRFEDGMFVNRLVRQVVKLANQGLPPKPSLIFPKFASGRTIRQMRS